MVKTSRQMTCVFDYDVRQFPTNPHFAETPFGTPRIVAIGNIADERDDLEEEIERLRALLREAQSKSIAISDNSLLRRLLQENPTIKKELENETR